MPSWVMQIGTHIQSTALVTPLASHLSWVEHRDPGSLTPSPYQWLILCQVHSLDLLQRDFGEPPCQCLRLGGSVPGGNTVNLLPPTEIVLPINALQANLAPIASPPGIHPVGPGLQGSHVPADMQGLLPTTSASLNWVPTSM